MLPFEDLENLVKEAMAADEVVVEEQPAPQGELSEKLAASLDYDELAGNSKLGVAKMLTAIDILCS